MAEEIITEIIEKNHNNEIRTFPLENADYISKEKKYSQGNLETHQEKETETRNRDPSTSLFPEWHDANS